MTKLDVSATGMVTIEITPLEGDAPSSKFTVDTGFGDVRDRLFQGLADVSRRGLLFLTGRNGDGVELPVKVPVIVGIKTCLVRDLATNMVKTFNTLVDHGWTPVLKTPSGREAWTVEMSAKTFARPVQEVGRTIKTGETAKTVFRRQF